MGNPRTSQRERFVRLVAPVVAGAGYDLEELRVEQAGRRSLVRIVVDRDGGVSLDDCAELSRAVSVALDDNDDWAAPYTLEVSSPGVDRPLVEPRHWRRATGRLVRVTLPDGGTLEGRVLSADAGGVVFDVAGEHRRLGFAELGKGKVQVEFKGQRDGGPSPDAGEGEA